MGLFMIPWMRLATKENKLVLWVEKFQDLVGGSNDQTFETELEKAVSDLVLR